MHLASPTRPAHMAVSFDIIKRFFQHPVTPHFDPGGDRIDFRGVL
ncbi:MAG: hypothetical protein ACM3MN_09545 [Nitrospirota bacterium]